MPLLVMRDIDKRFQGSQALAKASLEVEPAEIMALIGQNGAGKSTMIKVLTGAYSRDAGVIEFDGKPVAFHSPQEAQRGGVSTIFQEVNLVPFRSVTENIFLGREHRRFGLLDWPRMNKEAATLLRRFAVDIEVHRPLMDFSTAIQQMVAIARAVSFKAKLVIMDEPTSSLDEREVAVLFDVMRQLRREGVAVIFVSHRLDELFEVCDRVTIMRDGRTALTSRMADIDKLRLVSVMIGRDLESVRKSGATGFTEAATSAGAEVMAAEGLQIGRRVRDARVEVRERQIVGLAGLLGSGRTETARAIFGADPPDAGVIRLHGRAVQLKTPAEAIALGVGYCSEDRKADGIVPDMSVRENMTLAILPRLVALGVVDENKQREIVDKFIKRLSIKASSPEQKIRELSGGNQQKVLLARWLCADPKLLILDEPTRGIDVGAKAEIQALIRELADQGLGVLMISSELEEIVEGADRVFVLSDGRTVADLPREQATAPAIMAAMAHIETQEARRLVVDAQMAATGRPKLGVATFFRRYAALTGLVVLLAFNFAVTPNFASVQTLNVNLTQVAEIVIVAVGMTLVISTGGIDLSVGSLMAIAGALAPLIFLSPFGVAYPILGDALAFVAPVVVATLLGFFNGWFITRFRVQPIVGTLVMFIAGRGVGQVLTNGNLQVFHNPVFQFIGLGRIFGVPFQVILMLLAVGLAAWMLRRTLFGRHVLAVGGNERAARLSGIPVDRVKQFIYAISGLCAGIAGLVVISINSSSDANLVGLGMELDAIAAVAVGGTPFTGGQANVIGSMVGALLIQLLRYTLLANGVPDAAALVVKGAIIAGAVWSQQRGENSVSAPKAGRPHPFAWIAQQRVLIALAALIAFGALRYDNFLGAFNVLSVLRYNSMFALTSLGMAFVIMNAGIDLSVGTTAACASVVSALLSPYGLLPGLLGGVGAGLAVGLVNAFMITRMRILPFIATLSGMLMASGTGLLLAHNQSVSVSYDTDFTWLGQGDLLGFPVPAWIAAIAYIYGSVVLNYTAFGRHILAIGGNEEASRLMGLPVDAVMFWAYVQSGICAGLAGVILAAQFGAGQPAEGVGWELFSIAAVVVGGTLLTGGMGSVATTLFGVLLLGLIFNVLNFENGLGWISLSAFWQSVIRGVFLMVVVMAGSGRRRALATA